MTTFSLVDPLGEHAKEAFCHAMADTGGHPVQATFITHETLVNPANLYRDV